MCEVLQVKIARTFTIDYHVYQELRKKPNQSRIVERSIRKYLNSSEEFDTSDLSAKDLMRLLLNRQDCPQEIALLLPLFLHTTN